MSDGERIVMPDSFWRKRQHQPRTDMGKICINGITPDGKHPIWLTGFTVYGDSEANFQRNFPSSTNNSISIVDQSNNLFSASHYLTRDNVRFTGFTILLLDRSIDLTGPTVSGPHKKLCEDLRGKWDDLINDFSHKGYKNIYSGFGGDYSKSKERNRRLSLKMVRAYTFDQFTLLQIPEKEPKQK